MRHPSIATSTRTLLAVTALAALSVAGTSAIAAEKEKAKSKSDESISVNGKTIPAADVRQMLADRQAAGVPASPALTNAVRELLIARSLFAQEASKAGLDKNEEAVTRIRMAREEILARQYELQYTAQHPPTEAQQQELYDLIKKRAGDTEYHVRQIFAEKEEDANALVARLAKGEKFADLAKSSSQDTATRDSGGDLGWLTPLTLQPFIIDTVSQLKKGDYTRQPVKGQNGWHIVMVDDTRPFTLASYDILKPQLRRDLSRQALATHLAELRKKAQVQ